MPTARVVDEPEPSSEQSAAYFAARRWRVFATVLLIVVSIGSVLCVAAGIGLEIAADTDTERTAALWLIIAGASGWLQVALVCLGAQAVARYIEWRVTSSAE